MTTQNSLNLNLSGQTGTGSFVGSTSPTLVTPAIGTPSSGTLTNCTGLPASGLTNSGVTATSYTNTNLTVNAQGIITAASNGSGGSSYTYAQTYFVDQVSGSDSNAGTNINAPYLTVQKALTVIAGLAGGSQATINVMTANANNTEVLLTGGTSAEITINAQNTYFNGASFTNAGDAVTIYASGIITYINTGSAGGDDLYMSHGMNTYTSSGGSQAHIICAGTGPSITLTNNSSAHMFCTNPSSSGSVANNSALTLLGAGTQALTLATGGTITLLQSNYCASITNDNTGTLTGLNGPEFFGTFVTTTGLYILAGGITNVGNSSINGVMNDITVAGQYGYDVFTVSADATYTSLALAAQVPLILADTGNQYQITNIFINSGGSNFTGGGGNRALAITDGTTVYSVIPSGSLTTIAGNTAWGVTALPFPAAAAINTATQAGANLYLQYSGGTLDYTTGGDITITIQYARLA